jgi:RNA polymerase sigma-70 factor (ECF subfamily)
MSELPETRYSLLARLGHCTDHQAWSDFVSVYQQAVYRYVRSRGLQDADAWEVVQEVFLAVHHSVDRWSQPGHGSFRAWLLRIAFNISVDEMRRKQRQAVATGSSSVREMLALHEAPDDEAERRRQWRQWAFFWAAGEVQRAVTESAWRAFWLTAVEHRDPTEVASLLRTSVGAVYAAKCRVLSRIRAIANKLNQEIGPSDVEEKP